MVFSAMQLPQNPNIPCLVTLADGNLLLRLHVQPRAASNGIAGLQGELLKLRLTTPPVDGKANKAVITYLAQFFHLPKTALTITSGLQSRRKTVTIRGGDASQIRATLVAALF
jgi:uncharacterized protein (TIGR00251 family)